MSKLTKKQWIAKITKQIKSKFKKELNILDVYKDSHDHTKITFTHSNYPGSVFSDRRLDKLLERRSIDYMVPDNSPQRINKFKTLTTKTKDSNFKLSDILNEKEDKELVTEDISQETKELVTDQITKTMDKWDTLRSKLEDIQNFVHKTFGSDVNINVTLSL